MTLAVVSCHVGASLFGDPDLQSLTDAQYRFFLFIRGFLHWHVPVFFAITGMLMLSKRELTPAVCVRKYMVRILLALAVFGIPFALLEVLFSDKSISFGGLWQAVVNVINGHSWDHLWYLYTLIGIYPFMPIFKQFTDSASRREQRYVLAALFVFDSVFPFVDQITGSTIGFGAPITYPIFYLLLGKYIADETPRWLRSKVVCAADLIATTGLIIAMVLCCPDKITLVMDYACPVNVLATCCMICLFKGVSVQERQAGVVWKLDRLCFGVYIIHPVFLNFAYKFLHVTPVSFGAYRLAAFLFFAGTAVLSFVVSWIMSLIPPLKKYVL